MKEIVVVKYDPDWPRIFFSESKILKTCLGSMVNEIHHIGSTAVEGLLSKPVIDILIEVHSFEELDRERCVNQLSELGFIAKGENGIPNRRYYYKGRQRRTHQLHVYVSGNENIEKHLAFRDYLRAHKKWADEYAKVKLDAASRCNNNSEQYVQLKSEFVKTHERLALMYKRNSFGSE